MRAQLALISLLVLNSSLLAGPPPENKPMAPPPPPPPPPETTVVDQPPMVSTTVIVTNRVLTTNAILVTNVAEVTNAVIITTPAPPSPMFVYEQRLYGGRPILITPEQAQGIIDQFKANFPKLNCPRVMIVVNRVENPKDMTLADRQTARDVERLFGRPLRFGGASLVDQRVAGQFLGDQALATKDREAVTRFADVLLEVLISSRDITVSEISGDRTYPVPDIQATAIRLSDARIIGQATASDLIGKGGGAARVARSYDVRDIAEATSLSLMEDIVTGINTGAPAPAAAAPPPAAPAPSLAPVPPAVPAPEAPAPAK